MNIAIVGGSPRTRVLQRMVHAGFDDAVWLPGTVSGAQKAVQLSRSGEWVAIGIITLMSHEASYVFYDAMRAKLPAGLVKKYGISSLLREAREILS